MVLEPCISASIEYAIRQFARKLIDHPDLERDPVFVITTLREDTCAPLHKPWVEAIKSEPKHNGRKVI